MSPPPITIVMTTYFPPGEIGARRAAAASHTLETWTRYLRSYAGPMNLHLADDGSDRQHRVKLPKDYQHAFDHVYESRQERHGVGASLNAGCRKAFEDSPDGLVLYAVDDWTLTAPFDLTLWAEMIGPVGLGCLRLGPPHPGLTGTVRHWDNDGQIDHPGIWWLDLARHHFAFGHRPALYHRRLFDYYGWFDEDVTAYECERLFSVRWNQRAPADAPGIGLALPHPWIPIAEEPELELAHIDPRNG